MISTEVVANVSWQFQTAASLGQYQLARQCLVAEHDGLLFELKCHNRSNNNDPNYDNQPIEAVTNVSLQFQTAAADTGWLLQLLANFKNNAMKRLEPLEISFQSQKWEVAK